MTDEEDIINLGIIVSDNNNQKRKPWFCLGQSFSRSLIDFLFQIFVILLIICGWFWRIHFSETRDVSTNSVAFMCSAAGFFYNHQV